MSGGNVEIDAPQGDPEALLQLADQLDQHATSVGNLGASTLTTTQGIQSSANWTGQAAKRDAGGGRWRGGGLGATVDRHRPGRRWPAARGRLLPAPGGRAADRRTVRPAAG
jgi:hypothetical protein